jgi:cellobiose phosphorylase
VRYGLLVYEDIAHQLGEAAEAQWAAAERAKLDAILQQHAWDGQWFLRGYKETGEVLGSHTCSEGRIFQPIQSWAVISGAATPAQAKAAMDSVERLLETPYGVMCLMPPIEKADCKELRMVLMNPGEKENAGIFSHSQGWVVMANCILGDGDRAYRVYKANLPARFNDCAEVRRIEPYVYCQTTSSRYSRREGMSHVPWLTGAAAWSYFAATHYVLGIRPELDGLRIDPCIPAAWPGFSVTRVFRGKKIAIEVKNTAGKNIGVRSITLNGEVLAGNLVPVGKLKAENTVTCTIG